MPLLTADIPLVGSASALIVVALLRSFAAPTGHWRNRAAVAVALAGTLLPLLAYAFLEASRGSGRTLWEWSAAGGPKVEAHYRLDGIGAIGVAMATGYSAAAVFAATRALIRPRLVSALVLAIGLVSIALAVVDDLVAATVLLGVLALVTVLAALLVAPPPATARLAVYLAIGVQGFVLAALALSRYGGASFQFDAIRPTAISPGVVASATAGAALFAGLYPFVPWRYDAARGLEPGVLRGLLAMPAGIGATIVLLRLVGVTRTDLSTLGLPTTSPESRAAIAVIAVLALVSWAVRGHLTARRVGLLVLSLGAVALYPGLHWSHAVLLSAILTVLYAASVSLALPDQWHVVRYDVALALLLIALAIGTPVAVASALIALVADALIAIGETVWMAPHRGFMALVAGATVSVGAILGVAIGIPDASDLPAKLLASLALLLLLGLQLAHIARRVAIPPPTDLEASATIAGFLVTLLAAIVLVVPVADGVARTLGRPFPPIASSPAPTVVAIAAVGALAVAIARSVRQVLPDLTPPATRLRLIVDAADPVPAGLAAFRLVEKTASRVSFGFALFERPSGVGLALALIVVLLVWSVR
ncbi:MAG: hypothetical protein M3O91_10990 [Chloroflexota bacterium]|nr:hypothetical protein [Chloroflexota bacterium]